MKNLKLILAIVAVIAFPFISKAQFSWGNKIQMTVTYQDASGSNPYGPLRCVASNNYNSYPRNILNNTTYTFTGSVPSGMSNYWMFLDITTQGGTGVSEHLTVSTLESQSIGVEYYYHYVPKSPSGYAPVFGIIRNSAYNYKIKTYLIPL